jgi:hypothetical protein
MVNSRDLTMDAAGTIQIAEDTENTEDTEGITGAFSVSSVSSVAEHFGCFPLERSCLLPRRLVRVKRRPGFLIPAASARARCAPLIKNPIAPKANSKTISTQIPRHFPCL